MAHSPNQPEPSDIDPTVEPQGGISTPEYAFWAASGGPLTPGEYATSSDPDPADEVAVMLFWSTRVFRPMQALSNPLLAALDVGLPRDFPYLWAVKGEERVRDALSLTITALDAMSGSHAATLRGEAVYLRGRFSSWPNQADPVDLCRRLDEFRAEYERAISLAQRPDAAPPPAPTANQPEQPPVAFFPLVGYAAIFDCLREGESKKSWADNPTNRRMLRQLHAELPGPIQFGESGERPEVNCSALLAWKAELLKRDEQRTEERKQRAKDVKHTVAGTHPYGRDGEEVPEVGGAVKKRRATGRGRQSSDKVE